MIINYTTMFGVKPQKASSHHRELDTAEELDEIGIKQYQSLIALRNGHLECLKRMYGYSLLKAIQMVLSDLDLK